MNRLLCFVFGHRPFRTISAVRRGLIRVGDGLGGSLIVVECCERCHAVYWHTAVGEPFNVAALLPPAP